MCFCSSSCQRQRQSQTQLAVCCREAFQHTVISQLQFSKVFTKLTQQNSFLWDSQQIYPASPSTLPFPCHAICLSLTPVLGITQKAEEEMMPRYYPSPQQGARNICAALSKCCLSPAETRAHPKEAIPATSAWTTAKTETTL